MKTMLRTILIGIGLAAFASARANSGSPDFVYPTSNVWVNQVRHPPHGKPKRTVSQVEVLYLANGCTLGAPSLNEAAGDVVSVVYSDCPSAAVQQAVAGQLVAQGNLTVPATRETFGTGGTIQTGALWPLDRLDAQPSSGNFIYTNTGAGVNIYIVDSGVRDDHAELTGRVIHDFNVDGSAIYNTHGTHVAAVAAGTTLGVAKGATIRDIKVFPSGSAVFPDNRLLQGLNWIFAHGVRKNDATAKAVINLSLVTDPTPPGVLNALKHTINKLQQQGYLVVTIPGNFRGYVEERAFPYSVFSGETVSVGGQWYSVVQTGNITSDPNHRDSCIYMERLFTTTATSSGKAVGWWRVTGAASGEPARTNNTDYAAGAAISADGLAMQALYPYRSAAAILATGDFANTVNGTSFSPFTKAVTGACPTGYGTAVVSWTGRAQNWRPNTAVTTYDYFSRQKNVLETAAAFRNFPPLGDNGARYRVAKSGTTGVVGPSGTSVCIFTDGTAEGYYEGVPAGGEVVWAPGAAVVAGDARRVVDVKNGDRLYRYIVPGNLAAGAGQAPISVKTCVADGTALWSYLSPARSPCSKVLVASADIVAGSSNYDGSMSDYSEQGTCMNTTASPGVPSGLIAPGGVTTTPAVLGEVGYLAGSDQAYVTGASLYGATTDRVMTYGTSVSAPLVSGAAALFMQTYTGNNPANAAKTALVGASGPPPAGQISGVASRSLKIIW